MTPENISDTDRREAARSRVTEARRALDRAIWALSVPEPDWVEVAGEIHKVNDLMYAFLLWNRRAGGTCKQRRAERTCNVKSSYMEWETGDYSYLEVKLSCGHNFTWDDGTPPDYCPYCGAKVVDE